jgi:hypothetical protein
MICMTNGKPGGIRKVNFVAYFMKPCTYLCSGTAKNHNISLNTDSSWPRFEQGVFQLKSVLLPVTIRYMEVDN